ncbi:hypothetical protein LINGRAHAP2_LOCUS12337 [Linum grandiflorum]
MGLVTISMLIWCLNYTISCNEVRRYIYVMCTVRRIRSPIFWVVTAIHWLSIATRFSYLTNGFCLIISEAGLLEL